MTPSIDKGFNHSKEIDTSVCPLTWTASGGLGSKGKYHTQIHDGSADVGLCLMLMEMESV